MKQSLRIFFVECRNVQQHSAMVVEVDCGPIVTAHDYREILMSELEERRERNPQYSQRAFARDLGMQSGRLNEVLNGKQGLSRRWARVIATKLGFGFLEKAHFVDLVVQQHGRSANERNAADVRLMTRREGVSYRQLELDQFALIADWYHIAILELSKLDDFRNDAKWIADILRVSLSRINEALFTLERLGFLERDE